MRCRAGVGVVLLGLVPGAVAGQMGGENAVNAADSAGPPPPASTPPWELPPMRLARITGPIVLDGNPTEDAWGRLEPLPLIQHWPVFGGEMSRRTVIRVGYDDHDLYAAGWFYDDPELIQGNTLRRDGWEGDDSFDLIIDSYDDDETGLMFVTMPSGAILDQAIQNDAQPAGGSPPTNENWNTFWDAATRRTDEGWFAEVRIPLSSLGFEVVDGRAVMGLIASRYISRENEKHIFPAIPPSWPMAAFKPSRARSVQLEGVEERRALSLTPYVLGGVERIRRPETSPVTPPEAELSREVGADLKVGLSSNLTLDLTANTDFAQAEADALQVNLDRFGLFLPEQRPFFQERASIFEFDMGEGRLFHSRTIGISREGELRRILGGARLAGRMGAWDLGLLAMQVGADRSGPWENDAVMRVRRSLSTTGYAGFMVTSRTLGARGADLSFGADGRVAVGRDLVTLQAAHTANQTGAGRPGAPLLDRTALRLFWERRSSQGWAYDVDLGYSGDEYDPALGFEYRDGFAAGKARLMHSWIPGEGSSLGRVTALTTWRLFARTRDRSLESALARARVMIDFKAGHWFNFAFNAFREDVAEAFSLPGADIPAGAHDGMDIFTRFEMSRGRDLGTDLQLYTGSAFDGWRTYVSVEPWWRLSGHLTVGTVLNLHRLTFSERNQTVNADRVSLRVSGALDTHLSAEALVQYSGASRSVGTNLRIRYRFAEGRDLYIVLDEVRDLDDLSGGDARLLGRTDRRLLLKYSYAFRR